MDALSFQRVAEVIRQAVQRDLEGTRREVLRFLNGLMLRSLAPGSRLLDVSLLAISLLGRPLCFVSSSDVWCRGLLLFTPMCSCCCETSDASLCVARTAAFVDSCPSSAWDLSSMWTLPVIKLVRCFQLSRKGIGSFQYTGDDTHEGQGPDFAAAHGIAFWIAGSCYILGQ
jgi:hypothetical protein